MIASIASIVSSPPANALLYLDPGTGSFLLQIIIAAGMSVLFVFGLFRKKLAAFFGRLFGKKPSDSARDGGSPDDD